MTKHDFLESITQYIFFFFLTSFLGYLWEVLIYLVKDGKFYNRGFLYGPWLPVYGVGAVLMLLILRRYQTSPLRVFFFSMLLGSALELAIGWLLDHVWGLRYWNYTGWLWNLGGYICLYSVLGFGIAGVLWVCYGARFASSLWKKIPTFLQNILLTILIILFLMDCAGALIFPNTGEGITF